MPGRRSRRIYDPSRKIPLDIADRLGAVCQQFRPFPGARAVLHNDGGDDIFKGVLGTYGKIKGSAAFIAFIGDMADINVQEKVGYTGEALILESTALGLSSCWVGGFFRPEAIARLIYLDKREKILGVSPLGYAIDNGSWEESLMEGFGMNHRRLSISKLVAGIDQVNWPGWIKPSLEASRIAPSAMNRQPWKFIVEQGAITISIRTGGPQFTVSKRLDCGIAMLHLEIAALEHGVAGSWEFLPHPQVSRFRF